MYGAIGVELLEAGYSPQEALDIMVASDEGRDRRQVAILDAGGRTAAWTGTGPGDYKGHHCGVDYCAQGNSIAGPRVVEALSSSFERSTGHLAERLMDALDAAEAAGGDRRGKQSGAILVVSPRVRDGFSDRVVDIRVDDHREPLVELRRVLDLHFSGEIIRSANLLRAEGDLVGALAATIEARDRSPENDNAWVALATVQLAMGREDQMLESLRRAIELNPGRRVTLATDSNFESVRDGAPFRNLIGG
jgi:tetratricopeptide (TPR) repeat protein